MWSGNHSLGTKSHPTQTINFGNGIILLGDTGVIIKEWLFSLQGAREGAEKPDEVAKTLCAGRGLGVLEQKVDKEQN